VTAPLTGTSGLGGAAATESSLLASKATLGKDDFLRILVTQLRNQDPLNPMEGTEFATQLAQFSSVEQLIQMGEAMAASTAATTELKLTAQTTLGASMVGRDVILNGAKVSVADGTATRVAFDLTGAADEVTVRILDAKGKALVTQELGAVGGGRRIVTLDTGDLAEGTYSYEVVATNAAKQVVTASPYTLGRVDGMAFNGGTIALRINGTLVPMLDVVEVLAIAGPAANVPTSQEQPTP